MKKQVLFMLAFFAIASVAIGQIDTVSSPFHSNNNAFDWGMGTYQVGAEVIVKAEYQTANADSVLITWLDLNSNWSTNQAWTTVIDGGAHSGMPVDGIVNDTVTLPEEFPLKADFADHWILLQVRVKYDPAASIDSYSNGAFTSIAAYTDSIAIDTIYGFANKEQLGQIELGQTISFRGHYGISDIESVTVSLMHLNSNWGTVKEDVIDVYNPASGTGVKSGYFNVDYTVPEDFNTSLDLAAGDFFVLRTFAKYGDGTNKFLFSWLDIVDLNVSGVSLSKNTLELGVGASQQLTATVEPSTAEDQSVTWSSSDEEVAFVEQNGLVTGLKNGMATITVTTTDGGFTASCEVTVGTGSVALNGLKGINVYPNPADEVLNIEGLGSKTYTVSLYNLLGAKIKRVEIDGSGLNSLTIDELPKGIYILDISGEEGSYIQKISKR